LLVKTRHSQGASRAGSGFVPASRIATLAVVVGTMLWASGPRAARAAVMFNTFPSWNGTNFISPFGEGNTAVYGQTFKVPAGNTVMTNFTFKLDDQLNTDIVTFDAYVFAWDGLKATGSALFTSGPFSTNNNGGAGGFQTFSINTGTLPLISGAQYVAFFSAANRFNGINGTANFAYLGTSFSAGADLYPDGNFVFLNCGNNFAQVTTTTWDNPTFFSGQATHDSAFSMTFQPLPEPTALALIPLALAVRISRRRR
jgi:hypothetical protein